MDKRRRKGLPRLSVPLLFMALYLDVCGMYRCPRSMSLHACYLTADRGEAAIADRQRARSSLTAAFLARCAVGFERVNDNTPRPKPMKRGTPCSHLPITPCAICSVRDRGPCMIRSGGPDGETGRGADAGPRHARIAARLPAGLEPARSRPAPHHRCVTVG